MVIPTSRELAVFRSGRMGLCEGVQKQQAALKTQHATEALQQLNGQLNGKVNHAVKSFLEKVAPRSEDDVARAARERLQRARERVANLGAVRRRCSAPDRPAEAGM